MIACRRLSALVILLSLLVSAQPAAAAIALSFTASAASSGANATTTGASTSGCSNCFFTITCTSYQVAGAATASDSVGNTWVPLTSYGGGVSNTLSRIFYTSNNPAGTNGSHTFTCGGGASSFSAIVVYGFTGVDTSGPFDAGKDSGNALGSGTSIQPGSLTPSVNDCVLVTTLGFDGTNTPAINSSFNTPTTVAYTAGNNFGGSASYLIQTTAGATNPTWSWGSAVTSSTAMAVFKPAGGGGGATSRPCSALQLLGVGCEEHP